MAVNNNDIEKSDSQPAELNDQIVEYNNPNESLPFGIQPNDLNWEFAPKYYPSKFTIMKSKELRRFGGNCGGESVSIEKVKKVVARMQAARDAVGDKLDIAIDFHGKVHKGMAKVLMKELEPLNLMFIEEPVLTENEEAFVELQRHTKTPIATGERNYGRYARYGTKS